MRDEEGIQDEAIVKNATPPSKVESSSAVSVGEEQVPSAAILVTPSGKQQGSSTPLSQPARVIQHTDARTRALGVKAELEELRRKHLAKSIRQDIADNGESMPFTSSELTDFFLRQKEMDKLWRQKHKDSIEALHKYKNILVDSSSHASSTTYTSSQALGVSANAGASEMDQFFQQQRAMDLEWRRQQKDSIAYLHNYRDHSAVGVNGETTGGQNGDSVLVTPTAVCNGADALTPFEDVRVAEAFYEMQRALEERLSLAINCPLPESPTSSPLSGRDLIQVDATEESAEFVLSSLINTDPKNKLLNDQVVQENELDADPPGNEDGILKDMVISDEKETKVCRQAKSVEVIERESDEFHGDSSEIRNDAVPICTSEGCPKAAATSTEEVPLEERKTGPQVENFEATKSAEMEKEPVFVRQPNTLIICPDESVARRGVDEDAKSIVAPKEKDDTVDDLDKVPSAVEPFERHDAVNKNADTDLDDTESSDDTAAEQAPHIVHNGILVEANVTPKNVELSETFQSFDECNERQRLEGYDGLTFCRVADKMPLESHSEHSGSDRRTARNSTKGAQVAKHDDPVIGNASPSMDNGDTKSVTATKFPAETGLATPAESMDDSQSCDTMASTLDNSPEMSDANEEMNASEHSIPPAETQPRGMVSSHTGEVAQTGNVPNPSPQRRATGARKHKSRIVRPRTRVAKICRQDEEDPTEQKPKIVPARKNDIDQRERLPRYMQPTKSSPKRKRGTTAIRGTRPTLTKIRPPLYSKLETAESFKIKSGRCDLKWTPALHKSRDACERCFHFASTIERRKFQRDGHHYRISSVRGGCSRSCACFPRTEEEQPAVRLCRKCFYDTHKLGKM